MPPKNIIDWCIEYNFYCLQTSYFRTVSSLALQPLSTRKSSSKYFTTTFLLLTICREMTIMRFSVTSIILLNIAIKTCSEPYFPLPGTLSPGVHVAELPWCWMLTEQTMLPGEGPTTSLQQHTKMHCGEIGVWKINKMSFFHLFFNWLPGNVN